jgi:hypothetical protein
MSVVFVLVRLDLANLLHETLAILLIIYGVADLDHHARLYTLDRPFPMLKYNRLQDRPLRNHVLAACVVMGASGAVVCLAAAAAAAHGLIGGIAAGRAIAIGQSSSARKSGLMIVIEPQNYEALR